METERDRLEKARLRVREREEHPERYADRCPDTVNGQHGPTDVRGVCPWCKRKVDRALPRPTRFGTSQLSDAYREYVDPEWNPDY